MKKLTAILLIFILILTAMPFCISAGALKAGDEVKGNTVCEALGMDGAAYLGWLSSHENDNYYLGTPYRPYDHRNPNGDCKGAYGTLDYRGVPGMNCMGFVWHVLYKATALSGGKLSKVGAMAAGRLSFYQGYNITRKYFRSKTEMLRSGYLEKGDIIWMIPDQNEYSGTVYHHVGIYWGDGRSDVLWHSNTVTGGQGKCNVISKIYPMLDRNTMYIVLKVGAKPLTAPKLTDAYNTDNGVRIRWNQVAGAAKYRVFIKNGRTWKAIADTAATVCTYTGAAAGEKCTLTVRCITKTGKYYTSKYDARGISCIRCPSPDVRLSNEGGGIRLRWNAVKGAALYRAYVKTSKGYVKFAETTSASCFYARVRDGQTYRFTVRSVMSGGTPGAYHNDGFRITYTAPTPSQKQGTL